MIYEITTHRAEAYTDDSRKPHVDFADEIETDLSRRDFTINAMALELTSPTPTSSIRSAALPIWRLERLRTPLSPEVSFSDDPLRMLRAARFIAGYQLQPVPELVAAVRGDARPAWRSCRPSGSATSSTSSSPSTIPTAGLWFVIETGLADEFLPELPAMRLEQDPIHRHKDVLTHTIAVVENVRARRPARASTSDGLALPLFHDVGKPQTRWYQQGARVSTFHHHDAVGRG